MSLEKLAVKTVVPGDVVVGIASGQSVGANQGTPAANSGAWFVKITDGTDDAHVVAHGAAAQNNGLVVMGAKATASVEAVDEGDARFLSTDLNGNLRTALSAALPAGTNNIGDVDVLSLPALPAGSNNIGDVDVLTLPAIPTGSNTIGAVNLAQYTPASGRLPVELDSAALAALETITVAAISAAIPAGNNNIGDVDVASLPALPAGTNNIGDVDVLTLPVLPAGSNLIGKVQLSDGTDDANVAASNSAAAVKGLEVLGGICNASAPTLTDGRAVALSLTTGGLLRVQASTAPASPSVPTVERATSSALAANGGTADLTSTNIATSTVKKLRKVVFAATAQCRADLVSVVNGAEGSILASLLTSNVVPTSQFDTPHDDFITITGTAGTDGFRLKVTNLEQSGGGTADVYATFFVNE